MARKVFDDSDEEAESSPSPHNNSQKRIQKRKLNKKNVNDSKTPALTEEKSKLQSECDEVVKPKKRKKSDQLKGLPSVQGASEGKYSTGGLSSLFGVSASGISEDVQNIAEVPKFETKIVAKKNGLKSNKAAKSKENLKSEENEENVKPAERSQQRENRKKLKMTTDEKKRTIFVGNVPLSINKKAVKKLFEQFGKVESLRERGAIPAKESLGKHAAAMSGKLHNSQNSSIYYVKFFEEESVKKALSICGTELEGHKLRVDGVAGRKDYDSKATIFVGNLPFDANEDDVSQFFEQNVGPVLFTRCVKDNATGMGKGFAFVSFKDPTSVDLALETTELIFKKKTLRVSKVLKKSKIQKMKLFNKIKKKGSRNKQLDSKLQNFKFSTRKESGTDSQRPPKKHFKKIKGKGKGSKTRSVMV